MVKLERILVRMLERKGGAGKEGARDRGNVEQGFRALASGFRIQGLGFRAGDRKWFRV